MSTTIQHIALLLLLLSQQFAFGQTDKEKALEQGQAAIKLEDEGKIDDAIKLLKKAQKLDPEDINYPYELAYAYYAKQDYKLAVKSLEEILTHKDVNDRVYQLLGNCYDNMGKGDEAMTTYKAGLQKFPNAGNLYLETGILLMGKKDYDNALANYEKGIEADPQFSSNYYWAARIYCSSTEEVWGMIYGEIFVNIERNTKRTAEISKLLYDTYSSQIKFTAENSFSVSFSQNASMSMDDLKDGGKMKLPYGIGVYEPTLMLSMVSAKSVDLNSLVDMRSNFVDNYYSNGHDKTSPNVLFAYQKQIKDAGQMEAYNHWVLMMGDEDGFRNWQAANKDKWTSFTKWFGSNGIPLSASNKFYSAQY